MWWWLWTSNCGTGARRTTLTISTSLCRSQSLHSEAKLVMSTKADHASSSPSVAHPFLSCRSAKLSKALATTMASARSSASQLTKWNVPTATSHHESGNALTRRSHWESTGCASPPTFHIPFRQLHLDMSSKIRPGLSIYATSISCSSTASAKAAELDLDCVST